MYFVIECFRSEKFRQTLKIDLKVKMSGKKLINKPENVVDEALEGLTMIHPGLRLLEGHRVVLREQVEKLMINVII